MSTVTKAACVLSLLLAAGLALTATPQQSTPEGYVPRGTRPGKGLAPGMKVTDLGKGARTYRVNMAKGDEIMSGLTEFAEKYHIRNGHFTAVGAINKGLFGWSEGEGGRGQKKIELNQEAEIVSLIGSISVNNQGRSNVHGHGSVALSDGSVRGGQLVGGLREYRRGSLRHRGGRRARTREVTLSVQMSGCECKPGRAQRSIK